MLSFKAVLGASVAVVAVFLTSSVFAQDSARIDRLETRMGAVESKLDALLEMMSHGNAKAAGASQQSSGTEAADASEDASALSEMKPGMAYSLYVVPNERDLAAAPTGTPVASIDVSAPKSFEYSAFLAEPSMKGYSARQNGRLGMAWLGYVNVADTGSYTFQSQVSVDGWSYTQGCLSSVTVDGHLVSRAGLHLEMIGGHVNPTDDGSAVDQGQVKLAAGLHEFVLWGACAGDAWPKFEKVHFNFLMKEPKDRAPKPFDPDRFMINQ